MCADGASEEDRNAVLNGLRVFFRSDLTQVDPDALVTFPPFILLCHVPLSTPLAPLC